MKVMGVDVSSSCTGVTIVDSGQLYKHRPELVAVSTTSFSRNVNVTRVIARYEGVTIAAARLYSADVVDVRDSEARKLVLSRGNLSKEEAYNEVLLLVPDYNWLPFKKGGNDQTDAYVIAEAAPFLEYS
jgi:Holliday junction resolvasome RuvABC endonuclease subunit